MKGWYLIGEINQYSDILNVTALQLNLNLNNGHLQAHARKGIAWMDWMKHQISIHVDLFHPTIYLINQSRLCNLVSERQVPSIIKN